MMKNKKTVLFAMGAAAVVGAAPHFGAAAESTPPGGYYQDSESAKKQGGVSSYLPRPAADANEAKKNETALQDRGQYMDHKSVVEAGGVSNYVTRGEEKDLKEGKQTAKAEEPQAQPEERIETTAAAPERSPDELLVNLRNELYFETDRAEIRDQAMPHLAELGKYLSSHPDSVLRVEGHTDSTGPKVYNKELSQKRAGNVARVLMNHGAKPDQIQSLGLGERQPVATNSTDEGRAMNRRVEIQVETTSTTG